MNSYGNLTSFLLLKKRKKKKKDRCTSLAAMFWMLMLDDYTIEELSSDEFDKYEKKKISRKNKNKFRLVQTCPDVTDII